MDRQAVIGFVLIGIALLIWMALNAPQPGPRDTTRADSVAAGTSQVQTSAEKAAKPEEQPSPRQDTLGCYFSQAASGQEKVIIVETDLYRVEVSTRGGLIRKWELKDYKAWDKTPVQLVDYDAGGDFSLLFATTDGKLINTRYLFFRTDLTPWKHVVLSGDETFAIDLILVASNGGQIVKTLKFTNGTYSFDCSLRFDRMEEVISGFEYQVVWEKGLRYAEHNSVDESNVAMAYAHAGGELVELEAGHEGEPAKSNVTGTTEWVATRTKYFALAILPKGIQSQGAYLEGNRRAMPNGGMREIYNVGLRMPYRGPQDAKPSFVVFLGPLDFDVVKSYGVGLDQIMSLGAAWIIRPIAEWVMIPLFQFLRSFIPNYGIVIIVFSFVIKVALYPLTKSSMKSMKKMQGLQPMMEEIKVKYKDDPQKMNRQVMQLYKEYGVNPAGGCLPLLLQLPILYALWAVFRSAIELRQANFVWWIKDLSVPDNIATLPFRVPVFGVQDLSGLALLMGITMFVQQKMTVKDPRQKMMVWMMPVLFTLLFNSFPSGLNLYYFVFNLLSIGQQVWINKQHGNEPPRKVEAKKKTGGIMNRLTKDLPRTKR
jgi:YidC/Oxa1 family membrane protein insertase